MSTVLLGSGCFWSKQYYLDQFPGVISTHVGFAGGTVANPTYKQVCHKQTGHAEVVQVNYDPAIINLKNLLIQFFGFHDATIDRRDRGGQYRSAIFFPEKEVEKMNVAQSMLDFLHENGQSVVTELRDQVSFYPAEGRHQQYCQVRGITPKDRGGIPASFWANFTARKAKV